MPTAVLVIDVTSPGPARTANHGDEELVVYAHGAPPDEGAEVLPGAVAPRA